MARSLPSHVFCLFGALLLVLATGASASPPALTSAVSRMQHGTAGWYDIQLPLTGGSGIECRNTSKGVTLVLTFDQAIKGGSAQVTAGKAKVAGTKISTNKMTISLSGATSGQAITVWVTRVANAAGELAGKIDVPLRVIKGDVDASGAVTADDVNAVKALADAQAKVSGANFRGDINLNGQFGTQDVTTVQGVAGNPPANNVAAVATANTPPTISQVPNQTAITGLPTTPAGFTVGDAESDPSTITVTGSSSDTATVPNANIALTGTGASRTVQVTPIAGLTSVVTVTITLVASDGVDQSAPMSFTVTVTPPPTTYLATLTPISSTVKTLAFGSATLTVSGDQKSAVLRYSYSNLAGADTDDAIYAPGDSVMYDIPVGITRGDKQPDGSIKWTFNVNTAGNINATIAANQAYIIIESSAYPAGELKGIFIKVNGSQIFTPPGDPPAITINPPTKYDASRFLQQGAFGGKASEVAALSDPAAPNASTALNDWINTQFNIPEPIYPDYSAAAIAPQTMMVNGVKTIAPLTAQSSAQPYTASSLYFQAWSRVVLPQTPLAYGDSFDDTRIHEGWWKNAVSGPDQLRQRVATALSELTVVSENEATVDSNFMGLCTYYDMLANDAFTNYRKILEDVTLHPIMGQYLNMKGNKKAAAPASPNENYAREIMQLFSIGLYMLQPDGTLQLDQNGQPIPTYDQTGITNLAQVMTGWDQSNNKVVIPYLSQAVAPATGVVVTNFNSFYQRPMVVTPANHSTTVKNLLVYSGCPTYPGASQPGVIPPRSQQTAATATAELKYALDNIFYHPNVGPFVCKQLIQRLVGSNPSPGYVYRVAKVFADNGSGVRGDMKAVITAILTDYEARSPALLNEPGYGHCREPMIRMAQLLRSCGAFSKTGKWKIGRTDAMLSQTFMRSPTVFNFFDPKFADPGTVAAAGIVSPELEIIFATTITSSQNMIYTGVYSPNYTANPITGTGFRGDTDGSDVYMDFTDTGCGLLTLAQTRGSAPMVDQAAVLIMGQPLDPKMKAIIMNFIATKVGAADYYGQVKAAVHLIGTSSQAAAQR